MKHFGAAASVLIAACLINLTLTQDFNSTGGPPGGAPPNGGPPGPPPDGAPPGPPPDGAPPGPPPDGAGPPNGTFAGPTNS